jgi:hypothetical protein
MQSLGQKKYLSLSSTWSLKIGKGGHFLFLFFISEDRFYIHGRGQYQEYCPSDDKSHHGHSSLCDCITQQT